MIDDFEVANGGPTDGRFALGVKAGVSFHTIGRVKGGLVPKPETARKIALAAGSSNEEAIEIAKEVASFKKGAAKTA